jgi:hypothetical protein
MPESLSDPIPSVSAIVLCREMSLPGSRQNESESYRRVECFGRLALSEQKSDRSQYLASGSAAAQSGSTGGTFGKAFANHAFSWNFWSIVVILLPGQ